MNKTTVHHQNNDGTHFWPKKSLKVDQDHPTTFCQESLGLSCWIHQQAFVASQAVFDGFLSAHPSQWSLIGRDLWSLCVFRSAINSFWQNLKDSWITTADYSAFANVSLVRLETSNTNKALQIVKWYHFIHLYATFIYLSRPPSGVTAMLHSPFQGSLLLPSAAQQAALRLLPGSLGLIAKQDWNKNETSLIRKNCSPLPELGGLTSTRPRCTTSTTRRPTARRCPSCKSTCLLQPLMSGTCKLIVKLQLGFLLILLHFWFFWHFYQ